MHTWIRDAGDGVDRRLSLLEEDMLVCNFYSASNGEYTGWCIWNRRLNLDINSEQSVWYVHDSEHFPDTIGYPATSWYNKKFNEIYKDLLAHKLLFEDSK